MCYFNLVYAVLFDTINVDFYFAKKKKKFAGIWTGIVDKSGQGCTKFKNIFLI